MPKRAVAAAALSILVLAATPGLEQPPEPLVGGRSATFKDSPDSERDQASVRFVKDPSLYTIADPTCAASPSGAYLRFSTDGQMNVEVNLPCEN